MGGGAVVAEDDETVCLNMLEVKSGRVVVPGEEGGDQAAGEAGTEMMVGGTPAEAPLEEVEVVTVEIEIRVPIEIRVEAVGMALEGGEVGKAGGGTTTEVGIEGVAPAVDLLRGFSIATKLANSNT